MRRGLRARGKGLEDEVVFFHAADQSDDCHPQRECCGTGTQTAAAEMVPGI